MSSLRNIYVGYDSREIDNYVVCVKSAMQQMKSSGIGIKGLELNDLRRRKLFSRPMSIDQDGRMWDPISQAPQSTEFSISRFLVPVIQKSGWALFCDCDTMWLEDPAELFALADPQYAVMCVKHVHIPTEDTKKSGEIQLKEIDSRFPGRYTKKNWSSVMLFNCDHPSNEKLTLDMVNTLPGRDLHAFCWLEEHEIGALPMEWNFLIGVNEVPEQLLKLVHWTLGSPRILPREKTLYFDEYHHILSEWASSGGVI